MKSVQQSTSSYVNKLGSSEIQFEKKTVYVSTYYKSDENEK